jgi:hypothetical protein
MDERSAPGPRAVLIERNKLLGRRLLRYMTCAGFETSVIENPSDLRSHLDGLFLIAADAFDAEQVIEALAANPGARALLWTAEPLARCLRYVAESPQTLSVLGRPDFESIPRGWELMMSLRRALRPRDEPPKFAWYLHWGFTGFQERITDSACRDRMVHKVQRFASHIGARKQITETLGELVHELLMNAMYDAPVDDHGNHKYKRDRKANLVLPHAEQPTLRLAADGTRIAVQVTDPFGGLQRRHVFDGLVRGLSGGRMDRSHGGAGLGMMMIHNATSAMFFDVSPGERTEVTGIVELEANQRDQRAQARSIHFFST